MNSTALHSSDALSGAYGEVLEHLLNGVAYCRMLFKDGLPHDFVYLYTNPAFHAQTGLPDVTGRRVSEVIPGILETDGALFEAYGRVASGGDSERFEIFVEALQHWFAVQVFSPKPEHFVAVFDVVTDRKRQELSLRSAEERLALAQRASRAGAWDWDIPSGRLAWSDELFLLFGLTPKDTHASFEVWRTLVHPEDIQMAETNISNAIRDHQPLFNEYRIILPDGSSRWIAAFGDTVYDSNDQPLRMTGLCLDITESKHAHEALLQSLKDKQALLHEVHHRVKNNLQVIISLLRLERGRSTQADTKAVLTEMQGRIQSMALLHESLYRTDTFASVELGSYLRLLANQAIRAQTSSIGNVRLNVDFTPVHVSMDFATPCGLLVNELISNCLKHGFPQDRSGEVTVELQPVNPENSQADALWRLCVSDNGVGLSPDFEVKRKTSLGLQLVDDLSRQINGVLAIQSQPDAGTRFTLTFKLHPSTQLQKC